MSKTKKIVTVFVVVAILLVGVGYAAITDITLKITGTATASGDQNNFVVEFVETPAPSVTDGYGSAQINDSDKKVATFTVENLTKKGDSATATFTVKNSSKELDAKLDATVTCDDSDDFDVTKEITNETLPSTDGSNTTEVKVTVTLKKTIINDVRDKTVTVNLTATPQQPVATP